MTTLTVETPTLSPANKLTNHALLNAMAALHRLNGLGCTVRALEGDPVQGATLLLAEPPNNEALASLESALKMRMIVGLRISETRVAHLLGCQVEWTTHRSTRADVLEGAEVAA